jgi:2-keto-3-deoxy-6-phosphogluconate aldolase
MAYERDRTRTDEMVRKSGVCVVMNKSHIRKPEHMVTTMKAVYEFGYVAEVTFRIEAGILREAMQELVKLRDEAPADKPFILGVGSVINPAELEGAIDMGFDMIVAPGDVMGGYGAGAEFVKLAHDANCFAAPAIFTPTEFQYFIEREDENEIPDAVKIFPANTHGPKGVSGLLAPYVRDRHNGRIIMPTGGVNYETGVEYIQAISGRDYFPVLGMSAPLKGVANAKKPGDPEAIHASLTEFTAKFKAAKQEAGIE